MRKEPDVALTPLDTERLIQLYGSDTAYAASMFEIFLETVWPEFDTLDRLIAEKCWVDARLLAHKLRPPLGMVGLSDLEMVLAQFEELITTSTGSERISHVWYHLYSDLISHKPLVEAEWQRLLTTNIP